MRLSKLAIRILMGSLFLLFSILAHGAENILEFTDTFLAKDIKISILHQKEPTLDGEEQDFSDSSGTQTMFVSYKGETFSLELDDSFMYFFPNIYFYKEIMDFDENQYYFTLSEEADSRCFPSHTYHNFLFDIKAKEIKSLSTETMGALRFESYRAFEAFDDAQEEAQEIINNENHFDISFSPLTEEGYNVRMHVGNNIFIEEMYPPAQKVTLKNINMDHGKSEIRFTIFSEIIPVMGSCYPDTIEYEYVYDLLWKKVKLFKETSIYN